MIHKFKVFEPKIDKSCFVANNSSIIGNVVIGKNSSIWFGAVLRGDVEEILIGENSNIQDGSMLHCSYDFPINIGNNVTVGHGAILHGCRIGDDTLVGMGSIISDGVEIGKKCLIGSGALLPPNMKVPEGSMVLGVPAKVVRALTDDEKEKVKSSASIYVELANEYK